MAISTATAIIGGAIGGSLLGGYMGKEGARKAAGAQERAAEMGVDAQLQMFEQTKELLAPYVEAGSPAMQEMLFYAEPGKLAFERQQALSGLLGPEAQQQAVSQIERNPLFQAKVRQGEEAMLQNAAATGGLRGGNLQGALAQFRPAMLSQEIEDAYSKLGGFSTLGQATQENLAKMGQASAAGQAATGMQTASNVANLYGNVGSAQAQAALAAGQAWGNVGNAAGGALTSLGTMGMMGYGPLAATPPPPSGFSFGTNTGALSGNFTAAPAGTMPSQILAGGY